MKSVKKNIRMGGIEYAQRMNDVMLRDNIISDKMYTEAREFMYRVRTMNINKL
jgi:hypothetical protein